MAPEQVRKLAFFPPLSKNQTASDLSIYSLDYTRVHPEKLQVRVGGIMPPITSGSLLHSMAVVIAIK